MPDDLGDATVQLRRMRDDVERLKGLVGIRGIGVETVQVTTRADWEALVAAGTTNPTTMYVFTD